MDMDKTRKKSEEEEKKSEGYSDWVAVGIAGLGLAVAGGLYLWNKASARPTENTPQGTSVRRRDSNSSSSICSSTNTGSWKQTFMNTMETIDNGAFVYQSGRGITHVPENPIINNLDTLLSDIYVRYTGLKRPDKQLHYKVFDTIFQKLHRNMKNVDPYYNKYSSTIQIAGSHFDKLRIKKPDEYDIDIAIGLPLNFRTDRYNPEQSDIVMEHMSAGYVQLKMGSQFRSLPYRDGNEWQVNKTLFKWKDDDYYLLRSKFSEWFKSLVYRGLNEFESKRLIVLTIICSVKNLKPMEFMISGRRYTIGTSESGPAITLKIKNESIGFKMDVDLVPVLKFPEERWPTWPGYRGIPDECSKDVFMVVPKPIKNSNSDSTRSWRLSLIHQEKELLHDTYNLRQTVRFLKKLRDAQNMSHIASYYIKTLFFIEVDERRNEPTFWRLPLSKLFTIMVKRFQEAMATGTIPYFWNDQNNLIEGVPRHILAGYAAKLGKLVKILEDPSEYKKVAEYLLTPEEMADYGPILRTAK